MSKKAKRIQKPSQRHNRQTEEPITLKEILRDKGLRIFSAIFLTCMIIGYTVGRAISPVYDDPLAIRHHVAETVRNQALVVLPERPSYEKTFYPDRRLKTLTPIVSKFIFGCGYTDYTFNGKEIKPAPTEVEHGYSGDWRPRRGMSILDSMTLLLGGIEGYQIRATAPKYLKYIETAGTRSSVIKRIAGGLISLASGFGVGVYFGYSNDPQCSALFRELLMDKVFWESVRSEVKLMNTFYISYDKDGTPRLDRGKGAGKNYSSHALFKSLRDSGEQKLSSKKWGYSNW